jgi:hypothetical protein
MKTSVFNSTSASLLQNPQMEGIINLGGYTNRTEVNKKKLTRGEKKQMKGMIKSLLGIAYFVSLAYFLFVLLT